MSDSTSKEPKNFLKFCKIRYPLLFENYLNDSSVYGNIVKDMRKNRNLSTRQLAKEIGTTHSNIIKIENGSFKKINLKTLNLLSNFFNCSYVYLLGKSKSTSATGTNRCFPNPSCNKTLFKYLSHTIEIINNGRRNIDVTFVGDNSSINTYTPYNKYTLNQLLHDAKSSKKGIKISFDEHIYYIYYFTSNEFTACKPTRSLTLTEYNYEYSYTPSFPLVESKISENANKKSTDEYEEDYEFFYNNREDFTDFLIVQKCSNTISPLFRPEHKKDSNSVYEEILRQLFYQDKTFQLKNLPLIDLLYEFRPYINGDFTHFLISIIRAENLHQTDVFKLVDMIKKFTEMSSNQKTDLYSYCCKISSPHK